MPIKTVTLLRNNNIRKSEVIALEKLQQYHSFAVPQWTNKGEKLIINFSGHKTTH